MAADACVPPNVIDIAAPLLLGVIWNWALYGMLVVQVYVYSYNFSKDRRAIKLLVYGIFFMETLQTILSGADLYYWFVEGFGNLSHLANPYTSEYNTPIIGALIAMAVQFFFSWRIWVMSGRKAWWLCAVICLFSIVSAGGGFAGGIGAAVHGRFNSGRALKIEGMIWLIDNAVCDFLIAGSMIYYLTRRAVSENLLTDHAMAKIIRLVVETNVLTTIVGIASVITVVGFPEKNWFTCPTAVLGKLYSNTLLVSFNNRISIRDAASSLGAMTFGSRGFGVNSTGPRAEGVVLNAMGMATSEDREIKAESLRGAGETKRVPQFISIV
ncbi:hypothetical protein BC834DRAFT_971472 [Gloeopeniophorella convolvens]|nr:hypothetical protein BC834DRAFT_971472 [Gloeopeniophorella convolvens]